MAEGERARKSRGELLDDLIAASDDAETHAELVELARCAAINLEHIRPVAEAHPMVGVAFAQSLALAKSVERVLEREL